MISNSEARWRVLRNELRREVDTYTEQQGKRPEPATLFAMGQVLRRVLERMDQLDHEWLPED